MVAIPLSLRLALLRYFKVRRWKANLAAVCFLPALASAGCMALILNMSEEERIAAGMAMIFPLFVVGAPTAGSLLAVCLGELLDRSS